MAHSHFWDTLSGQLQKKGPNYIENCTFRNKPLSAGDNVIHPASFSQSPVQEVQEVIPLVKTCEEDLKKVCEGLHYEISVNKH